jgi:tetraacyldisaccharide 4'-kinase
VAAARLLLARNPGVDVILADDGLQHYALSRDIELAVVDGDCCLGNGWMQPAGPLREPRSRLQSVDALVMTRRAGRPSRCDLRHHRLVSVNHAPGQLYRLLDPQDKRPLVNGIHEGVHAVAGIAHPENFFKVLEDAGLHIERHAFPDHHEFCQADFPQQGTVIMTEKDAIKCKTYAKADWWVLEWHADPGDELVSWLAKAMASPGKG